MKTQFTRQEAVAAAQPLFAALEKYSVPGRISIAGSLRRGQAQVSDAEIVYVPEMVAVLRPAADLFSAPTSAVVSAVDQKLGLWLAGGVIAKRLNIKGSPTWGEHNKHAIDCRTGLPLDLFSTTEAAWWVTLVVRTGPAVFNVALSMALARLGRKLRPYRGIETADGALLPIQSEAEVFAAAEIEWMPASGRTIGWAEELRHAIARRPLLQEAAC